MHIMKLECLGKLPIGMYAEMERLGTNLNEIDTTDCENSLESLQVRHIANFVWLWKQGCIKFPSLPLGGGGIFQAVGKEEDFYEVH